MKTYTIFINDLPIYLTDNLSKKSSSNFYEFEEDGLIPLVEKMSKGEAKLAILYHPRIKKAWKIFKNKFKIIKAGGGLVQNSNGETLCIYRNGKWDLPKGKLEKKEGKKAAALREVAEECGVEDLEIVKKLPNTYHIYPLKGRFVLKITYWYAMSTHYNGILIPQLEEGITKASWISKKELPEILADTYANIKLLFKAQ